MSSKQFSPELYAENDEKAKAAVMQYLFNNGMYVVVNSDLYGVDLQVYTGYKHKYSIEVEVKYAWKTGPNFPFDTVQIAHRKSKLIRGRKVVEFWVLSSDLKFAIVATDKIVEDSPVVVVPNKLVPEGEQFYQIPVSECSIVELTGGPDEDT